MQESARDLTTIGGDNTSPIPLSNVEGAPVFKHHETMWFEDGNVILVAQGIGFRVYKGALGRASEVFGDMFTLAKPSDPNTVEGCPVVELSDKAEDFLYLLDAVFAIGTSEYFRRDLRVPVHPVLAMFRMGSKCGVSQLRDEALRRLESFLLSREHVFESNPSKSSALAVVDVVDGWPISVINLARTFDIPGLLPGAFYLCSQLSPATLVGGVRIPSGDIERLSDDDLTICIQGRDKLISRSIAVAAQMVSLASQGFGCSGPGSCASRVQDFFLTTKHTSPREISAPILTSISICRGCQSQLTRTVTNYSTQTWKSLGGYFQLLPS